MMAENNYKNIDTLARLKRAWMVSFAGLKSAWQGEEAFRLEVCASVVGIFLAFLLPVSPVIRIFLIASLLLIITVELVNSAIEAVVDLVTEEIHPLAKNAKDMGSAAVFLCILQAGGLWSFVLVSCLIDYLE